MVLSKNALKGQILYWIQYAVIVTLDSTVRPAPPVSLSDLLCMALGLLAVKQKEADFPPVASHP